MPLTYWQSQQQSKWSFIQKNLTLIHVYKLHSGTLLDRHPVIKIISLLQPLYHDLGKTPSISCQENPIEVPPINTATGMHILKSQPELYNIQILAKP